MSTHVVTAPYLNLWSAPKVLTENRIALLPQSQLVDKIYPLSKANPSAQILKNSAIKVGGQTRISGIWILASRLIVCL